VVKYVIGDAMNYWKVVSRIATSFGAAFIVFATISGIITYELLIMQYGSSIPVNVLWVNFFNAMLDYLLFAVLSFVVAFFISRAAKRTDEKRDNISAETEADSIKEI
jgi:membrane protein implicated in regulation of membrane protease activity